MAKSTPRARRPTPPPGQVSLERALSKLGLASRTDARKLIEAGRVRVDGKVAARANLWVNPNRAKIEIDGAKVEAAQTLTVIFYKPRGYVTTRRDEKGRPTIYDAIAESKLGSAEERARLATLMPVGRLDLNTSGLLILTNDTQLGARLMDPLNKVPRKYIAEVRGEATPEHLQKLVSGVMDAGERLAVDSARALKVSGKESRLEVVLCEGKNREVRRLLKAVGLEVTRLKRTELGNYTLGDLKPGEWSTLKRSGL